MAPVAYQLATGFDLAVDPFLMAVALGASGAFLTLIGHQSNTLVMGPGGHRFSDYWKVGLPLILVVIAVALPSSSCSGPSPAGKFFPSIACHTGLNP